MIPFDDEELEYIARLDARADADLLRRELPSLRDSCLRTMEVSTTLLQVCTTPASCWRDHPLSAARPFLDAPSKPRMTSEPGYLFPAPHSLSVGMRHTVVMREWVRRVRILAFLLQQIPHIPLSCVCRRARRRACR